MTEENIEKEKEELLGMLTRIVFGIPTGSLVTGERDTFLWKCFIDTIKGGLRE